MKKLLTILGLAAALCACKKDFLDRLPQSDITSPAFFNSEKDLDLYVNSFYDYLPGTVWDEDVTSDNVEPGVISDLVAGRVVTPTDASSAKWTWTDLRNINYFLTHYDKAQVTDSVKAHYAGIARFFRAMFYFKKVQLFGDVPWYNQPLEANSPDLYKGRDPRQLIVDSILTDLDYAIAHVKSAKSVSRITKWAALALKVRVCVFEGAYRNYHKELGLSGTALLQQGVAAAEQIMQSGNYKLYSTGKPASDYLNLFAADAANTDEYILARVYDRTLKTQNANGTFITPTLGAPGLTKSLVNSYLMKDGTPFSAQPGYATRPYWEEVKDRDPRLAQTIRTPGYARIGTTASLVPDYSNALTGYQCIKFVTGTDQDANNTNTNDLPVFRYAEVLLNYAEAKAELGSFTQVEADLSINLIRARAGMPAMQVATLTVDPLLQAQYGLSDPKILEIRRERRVELAMEGFRYQDLMRWKRGPLLAEVFQGAWYPGLGTYDLNGDGKNDIALVSALPTNPDKTLQYFTLSDKKLSDGNSGNIIIHPTTKKQFLDPKQYLYPLPRTELLLNKALVQNPGWEN
ncbi:RagB/SusD family nutrient uptake outer membrane protein [Chitinophaga agrisoli]|uniref:RagB/SusD family nutrient uptake outer membrane protein n=1 Tax=Chitinophaga agrisoli TaxID=2607653 RepID=A0A5B2VTK8_9BACT|nr:RagB/SusD family nutrient uptake outer membrane protein [Chitinophaga agrisoli]KAA2242541.1 RagB/SusD family nutrient uptake outer membrane protein [Chitinophaga agrisoli]